MPDGPAPMLSLRNAVDSSVHDSGAVAASASILGTLDASNNKPGSIMVTSAPADNNPWAHEMPAGPEPTTKIKFRLVKITSRDMPSAEQCRPVGRSFGYIAAAADLYSSVPEFALERTPR